LSTRLKLLNDALLIWGHWGGAADAFGARQLVALSATVAGPQKAKGPPAEDEEKPPPMTFKVVVTHEDRHDSLGVKLIHQVGATAYPKW
jgi:hypothetical protein